MCDQVMFMLLQIDGSLTTLRTIVRKDARMFGGVMHPQLDFTIKLLVAIGAAVHFSLDVTLLVMSLHARPVRKFHGTGLMLANHFLFGFDLMGTTDVPL